MKRALGRAVRTWPALAVIGLAVTPLSAAQESSDAADIADALRADPVYVDRRARPGLSPADAGRVRLRILDRNLGRIKIAVVPDRLAASVGGVAALANQIDQRLRVPGTLVVVAGSSVYAVVSYRDAPGAVAALRRAVNAHSDDGLAAQLLDAVDRIARVDPGPSGDLRGPDQGGGTVPGQPPSGAADDFLDGVLDTVRLAFLVAAAAIALPFVLVALFLWRRARRGSAEAAESFEDDREAARQDLISLGDELRALDLDVSMPGADPEGCAEYHRALEQYERADGALARADSPRRLSRAVSALSEGRVRIEAAKARFGRGPAAPPGSA